jgi:ATP-dependent Clp protease ATP-binding subunit ClpA
MFERFTKVARATVLAGVQAAAELGADKAGPEHLLLALSEQADSVAARVLAAYGVTADRLRAAASDSGRRAGLTDDEVAALRSVGIDADEVFRRIEEAFGPEALARPAASPPRRGLGRLGGPFDRSAKKVLELSLREAIALNRRHIGSEHLLLAALRAGVPGPMGAVLAERGVTYDDARERVAQDATTSP